MLVVPLSVYTVHYLSSFTNSGGFGCATIVEDTFKTCLFPSVASWYRCFENIYTESEYFLYHYFLGGDLYSNTFVFIFAGFICGWAGFRDWFRKNFQILFPETQSESHRFFLGWCIYRSYWLASDRNGLWNLWLLPLIQVRSSYRFVFLSIYVSSLLTTHLSHRVTIEFCFQYAFGWLSLKNYQILPEEFIDIHDFKYVKNSAWNLI